MNKASKFVILVFTIMSVFLANGCKKEFTPKLKTTQVQNIAFNSAQSGGEITDDGGAAISGKGVCWSTTSKPTISDNVTSDGTGATSFTSEISGLDAGTTYYVRAYAKNSSGVGYGNEYSFQTTPLSVPTVTTADVTDISFTSAKSGGNITNDGGATITSRGLCWSTTENPTTADSTSVNGSGEGAFTGNLTGLNAGTTYYIRAYAINSTGTGYGNQVTFSTTEVSAPALTTAVISEITKNSAVSGGNVTDDGGADITTRGICWSTSQNPSTAGSKTVNGTGKGQFISNITDLTPGTTYYVRAYATNRSGTAYGNQLSFTTTPVSVPALTTAEASDITTTSAVTGGSITSDGGADITSRGVCWSTSENPSTSGSKTINGSGTGSFTSSISGLTPGTTYYVRAYATNRSGTAYGNQLSFTTTPVSVPALTTAEASDITTTSAVTGGSITNDGGAGITSRGVCWSTSENPSTSGSKTIDGSGTGSFTSSISGLTPGTTYYIRAYAVNPAGTAYGNQVTLTTVSVVLPAVNTTELSQITSGTVKTGGSILSKGGDEISANGVCWSTTEMPTLGDNFTTDATGSSTFVSNIEGLNDGTVYYIRAYATNSSGTAYGNQLTFITPVADVDGNLYKTVKIGDQVWMAENLKTTRMNDNTVIPEVTGTTEWTALSTPAYSWLYNNAENKDLYGALYNWFAADAANLCPAGWHVPTDDEYNTLEIQLGLPAAEVDLWGFRGTDEGTQMKATSTWNDGGNGTNSSGFNVLGGGYRQWSGGSFTGVGLITYFWSSTDDSANGYPTVGWYRRLDNTDARVYKGTTEKEGGKYVRCVKD